ncbi:MAG: PTS sugar transporter subunit IIA [Candidatus Mcinerneyibacterium aminivorans]|jgi:mannitol/fructose-specific phosphotransferase system IIA component (Ntr-type)|uniref:PTS sugar transporter subunit IIA n=1 Tax=Candidatus Mcinerneyibacterium aminivorans TaxID=2703815 RepID=A0A5D0MCE5_9BACT|nr:MAG: PTS sugar transporter subunit IIA [Candidatus Mcinerneyibacterium aminivorans]
MELKENIYPELIFVEEKEFDRNELFDFLTKKIGKLKKWDHKKLLDAINRREKKLTTGIGLNVAIPHARIEKWGNTVISCMRAKNIKNYPTMDNSPVQIVFLFISDRNNPCEHVNIISKISYIIAEDNNIEILKAAKTKNELYNSIIEMCETL